MPIKHYTGNPCQANSIIAKFGGARPMAQEITKLRKAIDPAAPTMHPSTIYRWMMPIAKGGTGGLIPSSAITEVIQAARMIGILLCKDDLLPIKAKYDEDA